MVFDAELVRLAKLRERSFSSEEYLNSVKICSQPEAQTALTRHMVLDPSHHVEPAFSAIPHPMLQNTKEDMAMLAIPSGESQCQTIQRLPSHSLH